MKFKIGDRIKITNPGQLYSSYKAMAETLGADVGGKWKPRSSAPKQLTGEVGLIINIGEQVNHILIEMDSGEQLIISRLGIEKVNIPLLPDSMFEI